MYVLLGCSYARHELFDGRDTGVTIIGVANSFVCARSPASRDFTRLAVAKPGCRNESIRNSEAQALERSDRSVISITDQRP